MIITIFLVSLPGLYLILYVYRNLRKYKVLNDFRKKIIQSKTCGEILQHTASTLNKLFFLDAIMYEIYKGEGESLGFSLMKSGVAHAVSNNDLREEQEVRSFLSFKMGHRVNPSGVLHVPQVDLDKLNPKEIALFDEVLAQASIILERIHSHVEREKLIEKISNIIVEYQEQITQQREMNRQLQKNLKEISALYQIASTVLNTYNLDSLLEEIVTAVVRSFNVSLCFIFLRKKETSELYIRLAEALMRILSRTLSSL